MTDGDLWDAHVEVRGAPMGTMLARAGTIAGVIAPLALWGGIVWSNVPHEGRPPAVAIVSVIVLTWIGPAARAIAALLARRRRAQRVALRADREALDLGALGRIPRSELAQGWITRQGAVRLELRDGRTVEITADAGRSPRRLLDALGLGTAQRRVTFRWHRLFDSILAFVAGPTLLSALLVAFPHPALATLVCPMLAGLPWLLGMALAEIVGERTLTIAADGISATGRTKTDLVRFADLRDVRVVPDALELVYRDGRVRRVLCDPEDPALRSEILARLEEARERARGEGSALGALLEKSGEGFEALRAAAARVLTAATGFREATVTPEEVAAVLEDPAAEPEQRIAAAIALAATRKPEHAQRVRVAAEACVSPKLRVALEAAADDELDEETVERAIER